jgi:hypothetical protein
MTQQSRRLDKSSPYNQKGLMNQIPTELKGGLDESSPYNKWV